MRLTLRTLLAYLDDILDPEDANQLQSKIEDSEFATSLVQQIRGSVRRMRLDAPALDAQGIGGDLNSVAEYLDNVLPPEHVPALEKACLDNEASLGEVASCHQVLTLVLGEPATFTDAMRQRAYGIAPTVALSPLPPSPHYGNAVPATDLENEATSSEQQATEQQATEHQAAKQVTTSNSTVPTETSVETVSDNEPKEVASKQSRPSDDVALSTGLPSTKEAWRAEGQDPALADEFAQPATDNEVATRAALATQPRTIAVPIKGPGSETEANPTLAEFPDYMDRRGSWLRSAFVTGVMALLLLLGLLFATNPAGKTYLAGWLGSSRAVATNPATNRTVESADLGPSNEFAGAGAVSEGTPSVHVTPDVTLSDNVSVDLPPAGGQFTTQVPSQPKEPTRWADANLESSQAESPIPELATTGPIETPIVPEVPELTVEVQDQLSAAADLTGSAASSPPLPTAAPAENIAVHQDEKQSRMENTGVATIDADVPTANGVDLAATNLPPRNDVPDLLPNVPRDPPSAADAASIARANIARGETPLQIDSSAPIAEFSLPTDPLASPINPPIAAPTTSIAAATPTSRIPAASGIDIEPDLDSRAELGPTRLRRGGELALIYDAITDDWKRVDSTKTLQLGDSLQCLPSYRAMLSIGDTTSMTLIDATRVQLGPFDNVTLHDGKLLVRFSDANGRQRIGFQGESIEITAQQAGSVVAIEGFRIHRPGMDLDSPPHSLLKVYLIEGASVVTAKGRDFKLAEGQHFLGLDQFQPRLNPHTELPAWPEPTTATRKYQDAIKVALRNIDANESVQQWHKDRSVARNPQQRAMAARCLAEMGNFSAIVQALGDKDQRPYWADQFTTLRHTMTKGPDEVAKLQLELEKVHGTKANQMMELVRGYSAEQLSSGAARKLVELLSNEDKLEYRILAIENLKRIKGADHRYSPGQTKAKRRPSVNIWEARLNEVKYKQMPEIEQLLDQFAREQQAAG